MRSYNGYVKMEYGADNLLTRIINAVKREGWRQFTAAQLCWLLNEGGDTPERSINACLSSKEEGFRNLGEHTPYFKRIGRGVYALL